MRATPPITPNPAVMPAHRPARARWRDGSSTERGRSLAAVAYVLLPRESVGGPTLELRSSLRPLFSVNGEDHLCPHTGVGEVVVGERRDEGMSPGRKARVR